MLCLCQVNLQCCSESMEGVVLSLSDKSGSSVPWLPETAAVPRTAKCSSSQPLLSCIGNGTAHVTPKCVEVQESDVMRMY